MNQLRYASLSVSQSRRISFCIANSTGAAFYFDFENECNSFPFKVLQYGAFFLG
jgi:hypothetical protein